MSNRGKLFVFEGADAAGKSSLANSVHRLIASNGYRTRILAFPGNAPETLGGLVYAIHHDAPGVGIGRLTPTALQALHIAAHLDAIEQVIAPALESGEIILLDRFWWSTWVYGLVEHVDETVLNHLILAEKTLWGKWEPLALFYVTREIPLREEPPDKWRRLKQSYEKLILLEGTSYPIHIVRNDDQPEIALAKIFAIVTKAL